MEIILLHFTAGGMINVLKVIILLKQSGVHNQTKLTFKYGGSSGAPVVEEEAPEQHKQK